MESLGGPGPFFMSEDHGTGGVSGYNGSPEPGEAERLAGAEGIYRHFSRGGASVMRTGVTQGVLLVLLGGLFLFGTPEGGEGAREATVLNPGGPALIPMAGLLGEHVSGDVPLHLVMWRTQEEALGRLLRDPELYAVLPVPLGVLLGARSDLVLLAVHEWRVFSLVVSQTTPFDGWPSLAGKELYVAQGRGAMLDALTRLLLRREGLDPTKDLRLVYAPPQEIVALFRQGRIVAAVLPEPFATLCLAHGQGRIALDLQQAWQDATGGRVPVAGLFVHRDHVRNAPEEVAEVCRTLALSTAWSMKFPRETAALLEKSFDMPAAVLLEGWDRLLFSWEPVETCSRDVLNFFDALHRAFPEEFPELPSAMLLRP